MKQMIKKDVLLPADFLALAVWFHPFKRYCFIGLDVNIYVEISLWMFKTIAVLQKLIVKHIPLLSLTVIYWVWLQGRI